MKRWLWFVPVLLLALAGYVGAGPYLTINAIRDAVKTRDAAALAEQVDFPALRANLQAQLTDRIARGVNADTQANPLAAFGLGLANHAVAAIVEVVVTPVGLGAMMEGRKVWERASGIPIPSDPDVPARPEPLHDARYRYESLSSFTATVQDDGGRPLVFVLTRKGLRWRLSDIRLPR
jgi:hypothetical protein